MRVCFSILTLFFSVLTLAQNTITGSVTDDKNQPIPGANVKVAGSASGASSGFDGKFTLKTNSQFPFTLEVSMMGYSSRSLKINSKDQKVEVVLVEQSTSLNEIVVSASRAPERILESPVTIERMGVKEVKNTTAPSFYEGLENLKDVHFNTSSFNFKSVNTRGFATIGNTRFMQLVDGMDNASPALNFAVGNLLGISDLDVASVEVLPGASSALYGANAFNGIMFMNSRSPFAKEGLSTYFKYGQTTQDVAGTNNYFDLGIRAAKKFTDHFAAKANFSYMEATEWMANDRRSLTPGGIGHEVNRNYDGLNIYGDEVSTFIPNVGQVSRTGYAEKELTDGKINSAKFDASIHIRPWVNGDSKFAKNIEIIGQYKVGIGNTLYQGANRYALKNFFMDQIKLEVKGDNFFARIYRSGEDAGDSYNLGFAAWNVNREAKSDKAWFTDYGTAYVLSSTLLGLPADQADKRARAFADYNTPFEIPLTPNGNPRLVPGTATFNQALTKVLANSDLNVGAKLVDRSRIHHGDLNYNFKDVIKFAEIQVGGSARRYTMNSAGSIFTDKLDEPITYDEYGVYTQIQKKIHDERVKVTASVRYDKSQNFSGNISPRLSVSYAGGKDKQHNFRASYQTGFRNPTTQDQYIGLNIGPLVLIGSAPDNLDRYSETIKLNANPGFATVTGRDAYTRSFTATSVTVFRQSLNPADLKVADVSLVKPERVQAFEVGYRSIFKEISFDLNAYYNIYNDFISSSNVVTPLYGDVRTNLPTAISALQNADVRLFQVYTNSKKQVTSLGVGIGVNRKIGKFNLSASYNYSDFKYDDSLDPDFEAGFNTPKHRAKASFGGENILKGFGFNVNARYNSKYLWESTMIDAYVPENYVYDAQVNTAIPVLKSVIKIGGTNLFGKDYIQVPGAGMIGKQYYISWTINP
ncbi:TonB-dependent receptor domain-containing protein [Flavobacterium columnare]|uniref:TonB-dependent receptor n=1 Tax=Flavobacterium columnare TaxID=996 RepID=A0A437UAZ5_9FLAO|nr:TonB-dependent receptor [Flavobacterium columnare]RVU90765.1 TonB-dependent receptor [Flavobacterium columnare]